MPEGPTPICGVMSSALVADMVSNVDSHALLSKMPWKEDLSLTCHATPMYWRSKASTTSGSVNALKSTKCQMKRLTDHRTAYLYFPFRWRRISITMPSAGHDHVSRLAIRMFKTLVTSLTTVSLLRNSAKVARFPSSIRPEAKPRIA